MFESCWGRHIYFIQKNAYDLGIEFFGKYSSGKNDLSTTYKQKLKDKINAKNNH
ncbi:hypothetical protein [Aliarcobacter cryaerophilus]|uniref:hypothetical protein n=1 Tax=Aliarcobacter cryaerophilus TaxID=28198 RepID=UPI001A9C3A74|nr:hypothetical protein [Aliarcobacter cryaerophilus]